MSEIRTSEIREQLLDLQDRICSALEASDGQATFQRDRFEREGGGLSRAYILEDGPVLERAAVNFSHTVGKDLPQAATTRRPELVGRGFEAVSISLITHPRNPYAPTSHANFRFFIASKAGEDPVWWFGGGFDLTPYYGFEEDARHWHATARAACDECGEDLYPQFKKACDEYFFLPHRGEARGIGGIFFDDWNRDGFEAAHGFWSRASESYLPAYLPILDKRKNTEYGEREREFQLYRRGRYVEFNLAYDRGTKFGLQAGARTESLLGSMPPVVKWRYDWTPEPGSPEAALYTDFLPKKDWLAT